MNMCESLGLSLYLSAPPKAGWRGYLYEIPAADHVSFLMWALSRVTAVSVAQKEKPICHQIRSKANYVHLYVTWFMA